MTDPEATRHGPGRILIFVYGVFALSATALPASARQALGTARTDGLAVPSVMTHQG